MAGAGLTPYQFEPSYSAEELAAKRVQNNTFRELDFSGRATLSSSDWCNCGECTLMHTDIECHCCSESEIITKIRGSVDCITHHASFESVVINIDALNTARHHLILNAISGDYKKYLKSSDKRVWRHIAYKQFVFWMNSWTTLEKNNRKVIPSSVVKTIRSEFPEQGGAYTGFQAAASADPDYFD